LEKALTKRIRVLELFAGIGSYTEALRRNDIEFELVGISEINKYAIKAHEMLHSVVENFGDISMVEKLPKADLWCYSAPCTDISVAGNMKGMDRGSKTASSLLWEVERLLCKAKENNELPETLLMENVAMLVSKKFITNFNEWLVILEKLGYKNYWKILNSKDYGIPQTRSRVFLVSIMGKKDFSFPKPFPLTTKLLDYLESEVDNKYFMSESFLLYCTDPTNRNGFVRAGRFKPHDTSKSNYAFTITTRKGTTPTDNFILVPEVTLKGYKETYIGDGGTYTNPTHPKRAYVQKGKIHTIKRSINDLSVIVEKNSALMVRKITPRESLRLMGWCDNRIDSIIDDFSDTRLYEMAGNAVVIDVLCEIFRELYK